MRTHRILLAFLALSVLPPLAASAQQGRAVYSVSVARGHLGFVSEPVPDAAMHQRRVLEVISGSPADKAGLREGDVVLRINGLAASPQVISAPFEPGDTVVLRIRRDGSERNLQVIAGERDATAVVASGTARFYALPDSLDQRFAVTMERLRASVDSAHAMPNVHIRRLTSDSGSVIIIGTDTVHITSAMPTRIYREGIDSIIERITTRELPRILADSAHFRFYSPDESHAFAFGTDSAFAVQIMPSFAMFGMRAVAGAELAPLNPELSEYFGAVEGVLVLNAAANTPAGRAGLRGGDVITHAGDTAVGSVRELQRAIEKAGRTDVRLRVLRHGRTVDVTLTH